jgi:hypothetical protein
LSFVVLRPYCRVALLHLALLPLLPGEISDRSKEMTLAYIDDVVEAFTSLLLEDKISEAIALSDNGFYGMTKVYVKTLGEMADILYRIKREDGVAFLEEDEFAQRLLVTYRSYKP